MTIACIAAARPNFMKVKPVLDALTDRGAAVELVHTGQHYDPSMSDVFFEDLGLRAPDVNLGVGSGSHAVQTAGVMTAFEELIVERRYRAVVVFGDVNPTLACSIVGAKAGALVAHVEAGLRSRDWGMPEEVNRVIADRLSDLLFAPSEDAVENLQAEGYRDDQVHLAGNVMIDTLLANAPRAHDLNSPAALGLEPGEFGLVTLHRPSNVDNDETLDGIVGALAELSTELPLLFPVHPRAKKRLAAMSIPDTLVLTEPKGYLEFLGLQAVAKVVLTDSGGLQEETTALGVPCLTLRDNTERPVTITSGTNQLVGTNPEAILSAARRVLREGVEPRCPALWDGKAGDRIADVLLGVLEDDQRLRPTDLHRGKK